VGQSSGLRFIKPELSKAGPNFKVTVSRPSQAVASRRGTKRLQVAGSSSYVPPTPMRANPPSVYNLQGRCSPSPPNMSNTKTATKTATTTTTTQTDDVKEILKQKWQASKAVSAPPSTITKGLYPLHTPIHHARLHDVISS